MTARMSLEQRYRRLLRWYPASYRRDHEDEILGVLMAAAPPGRRRPGFADGANLIWAGLRIMLRFRRAVGDPRSAWQDALAVFSVAGTVLLLAFTVVFPLAAGIVGVLTWVPPHSYLVGTGRSHAVVTVVTTSVSWQYVEAQATGLVLPASLLAAVMLRRRGAAALIAGIGALFNAAPVAGYWLPGLLNPDFVRDVGYSCWYLLLAAALLASGDRGRELVRSRHFLVPMGAVLLTPAAVLGVKFIAGSGHPRIAALAAIATAVVAAVAAAAIVASSTGAERRYLALLIVTAYPLAAATVIARGWWTLGFSPVPSGLQLTVLYLPTITAAVLAIRTVRCRRPAPAPGG